MSVSPREGRAALYESQFTMEMYVDRAGAGVLATAWALAARSRRSLVHLPLRTWARGPAGMSEWVHSGLGLDLVLLQRDLGFPPSRWKEVRARLGAGAPHTVDIPETDFPAEDAIDYESHRHAGWRDGLRFALTARTLFVSGTAEAFRWSGSRVRSLSTEAPSVAAGRPGAAGHAGGVHYCVELDHEPGQGRGKGFWTPAKTDPGMLHIEYAPGWRAA
ncbi:hypothetical protein [Kitasatospora sp. NBC_00458]|uniref:hypothetical protein n=1 Tax=Kitasatospora sp. NBC_00458 TaxID=2903568 RepID=UPI002E184B3E